MSALPPTTGPRDAARVSRPGLVLLLLCVAQFMLVLDISVTNVALASIQEDLGFDGSDLQWTITAYTLAFGGLLIFFGRAGDLWGRRLFFLLGVGIFGLASLLCGLAQTPGQLIAARALQGVGGAMVSPAALSLLVTTFAEGEARNKALGVWGAIAAGGAAAGMIIGGVLTDVANWRWVFFINVPVALLTLLAVPRVVPESRDESRPRLDVGGAVTVTAGLVALVYGLTQIEQRGLDSGVVLGSLAAAVLLLAVFAAIQRRSTHALVPFSLFRSRAVTAANIFSLLMTAVVVGQSFFLSLYLRQVLGYSPLRTGFALVPITITVVVVVSLIPKLLARFGVRPVLAASGLLLAGGMALQAQMPVDGTYLRHVLLGIVISAAGLGFGFVAATIAATSGVRPEQQGVASGVLNTSQQVGGAVGLAVLATFAFSRTDDRLAAGAPPLEALTDGFSLGFLLAVGFGVAAAVVALLLVPAGVAAPAQETAPGAPVAPVPAPLDSVSTAQPVPSATVAETVTNERSR